MNNWPEMMVKRVADSYAFECAGYDDGTGFYCPLWGSEECDWECGRLR